MTSNAKFIAALLNHNFNEITNLLKDGVDVNKVQSDNDDNTALHIAVEENQTCIVELLLKQPGIDIDIKNRDGKSALDIAKESNLNEILQVFEEYTKIQNIKINKNSQLGPSGTQIQIKRSNDEDDIIADTSKTKKQKISNSPVKLVKSDDKILEPEKFLNRLKITGEGLKLSLHGNIFQLKILMLFLWRALERPYAAFRLATEYTDAEKFDDVVFQYHKNDKWILRLVQAKHKEGTDLNSGTPLITKQDILSKNKADEFCIGKYFQSFLKIRQRCSSEYLYSILPKSEIEDIILLTNTGIQNEVANSYFEEISLKKDEILMFKANDNMQKTMAFKIKSDQVHEFRQIFEEMSDFNILVKKIAASFKEKLVIKLEGMFQEYYYPLMNEVFEFYQTNSKENIVKIRSDLKAVDLSSWNIINAVLEVINNQESNLNNKKVRKIDKIKLEDIKIKTTVGFKDKFMPIKNPTIQDTSTFVTQLTDIIKKHPNKRIILETSIVQTTDLHVFMENLKNLAGHVLVYDSNKSMRFSTKFMKGEKLPDQIEKFRDQLQKNFSFDEFKSLYEFEFINDLKGLETCKENSWTRKLPRPITDKDIEEFIDKFKFIVNYPNRTEIYNLLSKEIQDKFRRLDCEAFNSLYENHLLKWMSERVGIFYTRENASEMIQSLHNNLLLWIMDGVSTSYLSDIEKLVKFKKLTELEKVFRRFLENDNHDCLVIEGDIYINRMQLAQIFLDLQVEDTDFMKKFTRSFGYLFIQLAKLADKDFFNKVLQFCKTNPNLNLIVIECGSCNDSLDSDVVIKFKEKGFKRKMVFITSPNDTFVQTLEYDNDFKSRNIKINNSFSFNELDQESQRMLLQKLVKFQGGSNKVIFKSILDSESKKLIDSEVFTELIQNKMLEIGHAIPIPNGYEEAYYIERFLEISVEEDSKHNLKSEVMNLTYETLIKKRYKWTEKDIAETDESIKLVLISDVAGMGKTTLLTKVSLTLRDLYPNLWIVRMNLNDLTKIFYEELKQRHLEGASFTAEMTDKAIAFLVKLLEGNEMSKFKSKFEKLLFTNRLTKGEVAVLFDGFDEISPRYADIVIDLIKALNKSKIKKIIITTRPLTRNLLRQNIKAEVFTLKELSENEQISFLIKYWKNNINLTSFPIESIDKLEVYATAVVKKLTSSIKDKKSALFCGVPLQLKMLAVVLEKPVKNKEWQSCMEFIKSADTSPTLPKKFKLIEFYRHFVNGKFSVLCREKEKLDLTNEYHAELVDRDFKALIKEHQYLAVLSIFEENLLGVIFEGNKKQKAFNALKKIKGFKQNQGLVVEVKEEKPIFVHRTFAEYFVANLLFKKMDCAHLEKRFYFEFLFISSEFEGIRKFLHEMFQDKIDSFDIDLLQNFFLDKNYDIPDEKFSKILFMAARESNNTIFYGSLAHHFHRTTEQHEAHTDVITLHNEEIQRILNKQDSMQRTVLHYAAQEDNFELVEVLLCKKADSAIELLKGSFKEDQKGYDIDLSVQDKNGNTAAHVSALEGHTKMVEFLINHMSAGNLKATINQLNKDGATVLHRSASSGNLALVKFLVENGADLTAENFKGNTAVHFAASSGCYEVVEFLINCLSAETRQSIINRPNKDGMIILHNAVEAGNLAMVEFLLANGADVNAKNINEDTVMHRAAYKGRNQVLEFLIEGIDALNLKRIINQPNKYGSTPLHFATEMRNLATVKFLVEKGADPNAMNKQGDTPAHFAAQKGHIEVVEFLTNQMNPGNCELSINQQNDYGLTMLHRAAESDSLETVHFLITNGGEIAAKNVNDDTPAHIAAFNGRTEVLEYLIDRMNPESNKLSVNLSNKYGCTLLHHAAQGGNLKTIEFLVENGADMTISNIKGDTAAHYATFKGHKEVLEYFINQMSAETRNVEINKPNNDGLTLLHNAVKSGRLEIVEFLIKNGADLKATNINGDTAAHDAAYNGNKDILEFLIHQISSESRKLMINQSNKYGFTILHTAAQSQNLEIVNFLLENGADLGAKTIDGNTAAHIAAYIGFEGVVRVLIDHMSSESINQPNKYGNTLLHKASEGGNVNIVKLLVENGAVLTAQNIHEKTAIDVASAKGHNEVVRFLTNQIQ